jgi:superfamily II DNA/RNA helicase
MSYDAGFGTIGVSPDLCEALSDQGITEPFAIQTLVMPAALGGRDICGKAKTGSGKTLAFGIAAIERTKPATPRHPKALVLVPTRELAMQVAGVLSPLAAVRNLAVVTVYGGDSTRKQAASLGRKSDIVVATPGRLIDFLERGEIYLDEVEMVVLDEADRMADMGFTPQVTWVLRHLGEGHPQTMLFSATLDGDVDHIVKKYLIDPVHHEVEADQPTVDLMEHRFFKVHQMDKINVAASIINGAERCLVFLRTKRGADRVASELRREGVKVGVIHGDLPQKVRSRAMVDFGSGAIRALVATDVAARGLDVKGVDVVIHYDPAEDHKAYLHRSGRTARAGKTGVAVSLILWDEEREVEILQKRLGISQPTVEVFSNDDRLADLAGWDPAAESEAEIEAVATGTDAATPATTKLSPSEILRARRAATPPKSRRRRRQL